LEKSGEVDGGTIIPVTGVVATRVEYESMASIIGVHFLSIKIQGSKRLWDGVVANQFGMTWHAVKV
jgi:hypothetical protein